MSTRQPYYTRAPRTPNRAATDFSETGKFIDLNKAHLDPFEDGDAVPKAMALFDARAAACVSSGAAIGGINTRGPVGIWPTVAWTSDGPRAESTFIWPRDLLEMKWYDGAAPTVYLPTSKCLSALAYLDFFPDLSRVGAGLRTMVSAALLAASPGWCGSIGPGTDSTVDLLGHTNEGNYDMTQMLLLPMVYQFYDQLSADAREYAITELLARGRIHRLDLDDIFTSGRPPTDWDRAGYISPAGLHKNFGETENHILMIATARYLTNQLLYQRDQSIEHDNRRNANDDGGTCLSILLELLRNCLRGDFSEYNAKPYQAETRRALLNLCSFAYDHEVRLGARMVLDYIAAHVAVSSNDLRRLVPFRRRNEDDNIAHDAAGSMTLHLLDPWRGADPLAACFAMQAGNTRAYASSDGTFVGLFDSGSDLSFEVLSDYRLPVAVQDLFVNDLHRRFHQRLHRTARSDEMGGNRNCDNMELYAGSPSYLITAGGGTSGYAVDPYFGEIVFHPDAQAQQLGVSVTTSFMPTGGGYWTGPSDDAGQLVQFSAYAQGPASTWARAWGLDVTRSYGVAPDFACGHNLHLPSGVQGARDGKFLFIDRGSATRGKHRPGFYLAVFQQGPLALLEAFDTWLQPEVSFVDFANHVLQHNSELNIGENQEFEYITWNNRITATMWSSPTVVLGHHGPAFGAEVRHVHYGAAHPADSYGDAGNDSSRFLNGTVLNSPADAVVEISNRFLGTTITLDMSDPTSPRRASDTGQLEQAGPGLDVWVDFDWTGPSEGDVYRPFTAVPTAIGAVEEGATIRILPGATHDRTTLTAKRRVRLLAPIGGVIIGAIGRDGDAAPRDAPATVTGSKGDTWVQFDFRDSSKGHVPGPFNQLDAAIAAVPSGGTVHIAPGQSLGRFTIVGGKNCTLSAPIGQVRLGTHDWSGVYDHWRPIGGFFPAGVPVTSVSRSASNLDLFVMGKDGRVYTSWWALGGDWSGSSDNWRAIGGVFPVQSAIACVARTPDNLDLFLTGGDGTVYTSSWAAGRDWSGIGDRWRAIGGRFPVGAPISAVARTPDMIDLFVIGGDGRVYTSSWAAGRDWSGVGDRWRAIGGVFPAGAQVAAVSRTPDHLDLFLTGGDGRVYTTWWATGRDWSGIGDHWREIGGVFPAGAQVSAVSRTPDNLDLFVTGNDGKVYTAWWSIGTDWSGLGDRWKALAGSFPHASPVTSVARVPDRLDLFLLQSDEQVYTSSWTPSAEDWSSLTDDWRPLGGFFPAKAAVSAVARSATTLDLFLTGADGRTYTSWWQR